MCNYYEQVRHKIFFNSKRGLLRFGGAVSGIEVSRKYEGDDLR